MGDWDAEQRLRLFGEISRFVKVTIEGEVYDVPAELELLRCFQYLGFHIAFENFCWNATCENCATSVCESGKVGERTLTCQKIAEEGMVVEKLPDGITKPDGTPRTG